MKQIIHYSLIVLTVLSTVGLFIFVLLNDAGLLRQFVIGDTPMDGKDVIANLVTILSVVVTISIAYNFFALYRHDSDMKELESRLNRTFDEKIDNMKSENRKKYLEVVRSTENKVKIEKNKMDFFLNASYDMQNNMTFELLNTKSILFLSQGMHLRCIRERINCVNVLISAQSTKWPFNLDEKVDFFTTIILEGLLNNELPNDELLKTPDQSGKIDNLFDVLSECQNLTEVILSNLNDYNKYVNDTQNNDSRLSNDHIEKLKEIYTVLYKYFIYVCPQNEKNCIVTQNFNNSEAHIKDIYNKYYNNNH